MSRLNYAFTIAFVLIASFPSLAQIQHVEPLNWWVGMKNQNLQLLVNGKDIGLTVPTVNYPGVTIKKIHKADSKNYLFIDLAIAPSAKAGKISIRFKKDGKTIETYSYPILERQKDAALVKGFDASDAIYMIMPDRFANGDYTNDIVPGMKETTIDRKQIRARHGGDIRGIIDHLDYISAMGFTAIWPTPLVENDMTKFSYHGYAITNHYKTDPRFGTLNDYKELAIKAKQKGIKLIYDGVINHSGVNYWWMTDLPYKDWINFADSAVVTNHKRTTNQDPYASAYDKNLMTSGWFDKSMPDMNGANSFMSNYLIQNSIWWIETLQLGGIRQDTWCYSDKQFLKRWSCSIMNEYPAFNMVGEEWSVNPLITSYWQQGKVNSDGYTTCLKTMMDFPLQNALVQALNENEVPYGAVGLARLYEAVANDFIYADPKHLLVFGDNHDMDRLYTQLHKDVALTRMALTFLLTIRGIPQLFYGTEILMDNTGYPGDHGVIRTDFPGGWKGDSVSVFENRGLSADQLQTRDYLQLLLNWRKKNPVIAEGKTMHFAPSEGVYVYFRYNSEKTVMVVMNKNSTPATINTSKFTEMIKGKKMAKNVMTNKQISIDATLSVPEKSAIVLELY